MNDNLQAVMKPGSSVGIIFKHHHEPARQAARELEEWFRNRGIQVYTEEMVAVGSRYHPEEETTSIPKTVDWVVVLGGDGTLLGAARRVGRYGVPLLGVNLGGLGFLTATPLRDLYRVIALMVAARLEVERRSMLETRVHRGGREVCRFQVLNDVVINKGALARIIDLDVRIDDSPLTTFRADGLIISTPTGSTAYNLSAGGPIVYPTLACFILAPICPFTLTNRPIIVPSRDTTIHITMGKESEERVLLTFDGQIGFELQYGDRVSIAEAGQGIRLLLPPYHNYFKLLRRKLMWGGATYNGKRDD